MLKIKHQKFLIDIRKKRWKRNIQRKRQKLIKDFESAKCQEEIN